jgi:hypothetical protein
MTIGKHSMLVAAVHSSHTSGDMIRLAGRIPALADRHRGRMRRDDSRVFLARLLLVLDSTLDVLDEQLIEHITSPDQWVTSDHGALLRRGPGAAPLIPADPFGMGVRVTREGLLV